MIKDLTGQKFNYLTTVKKVSISGRSKWLCQCDCGNFKEVFQKYLINGATQSCGCERKKQNQIKALKMQAAKRKYEPKMAAAKYAWRDGCYSDLKFEDFLRLSQLNCYYCNSGPSNKHTLNAYRTRSNYSRENGIFIFNGLDRVDSSLGHTIENVVTSCFICNRAKRERSLYEFINHVDRLKANIRLNISEYRGYYSNITSILDLKENYAFKSTVKKIMDVGKYTDGDLDIDTFYKLTQLNCYYCGVSPNNKANAAVKKSSEYAKRTGTFIYNGLDRIDSNFKHNFDNVIPSCKYCNYAKQKLSIKEFECWIQKLKNPTDIVGF